MSVCCGSHFQYDTIWNGHDEAPDLFLTWYFRMSTLKYEAVGFCSDWRRSKAVRAGILNSSNVLKLVDWSLSLQWESIWKIWSESQWKCENQENLKNRQNLKNQKNCKIEKNGKSTKFEKSEYSGKCKRSWTLTRWLIVCLVALVRDFECFWCGILIAMDLGY